MEFGESECFVQYLFSYGRVELMSSCINEHDSLFLIDSNHDITSSVFFHWLTCVEFRMSVLIRSKIVLLTLLKLVLHGLISLQGFLD